MRTRPADLPDDELIVAAHRHWGLGLESVEYRPVGAGSHHWSAIDAAGTRWFLTVDDMTKRRIADTPSDALKKMRQTWETVRRLADSGVEFAVAPRRALNDTLLASVPPHYALTVFPYIDAEPLGPGGYEDDGERRRVLRLIGRLHAIQPIPN